MGCKKCKRRFDGKPKRALYSHIRERHFHMRHFKCKECNFLSYNRAEIQEHKEKHKKQKPIHQCDLCGFICDNSTGLIRHKRGRFCQILTFKDEKEIEIKWPKEWLWLSVTLMVRKLQANLKQHTKDPQQLLQVR